MSSEYAFEQQRTLLEELNGIVSEGQNPDTLDIDLLDSMQILTKINQEDQKVAQAVKLVIPQISEAVDYIETAFKQGGRLIYIGAGTSGRLGILDAVECAPTYSVNDQQVMGIIAGGETAFKKAVEGAEDSLTLGVEDLKAINLQAKDVVVGIAASGRTPYVRAAIEYAKSVGCKTVGVTCNPNSLVMKLPDIGICPVVGAEAVTGSTRMKSGTAQKLVLNMLSTASMIRTGKVYKNLMVDVNASNEKLHARAIRIVMQATDCSHQRAVDALAQAKQSAKLAILIVLTGKDAAQAEQMLTQADGFLRKAVEL
ncbi:MULTISPECIES: N-acetylmuramic acid 6-phosphate etherase [unclassified Pseudoalteromonas]|uniref:N-acetylmuramic acid 6-phosphate etherase n=1 Tax=unclassified Pseudoalteromonas TaxID=194690 RepID=UPI000B3D3297|nr:MULTISPECIES: N-acetylmuramic acid 6-phosphate etherase [unclassified Pseudoalteromonas]MDN3379266.1 N-acetylmuramic acid 6-phosphate etherase [Pseudoalteromonas sp. APC 3893]MDN3386440.1 N-acetylmuramic acid 6-phosphate etherase [Pseudoalteromonas sp. APC 4017]OUS71294.1 N-acetylmuramic acid 6-phosphate etherase [Pseudoalteromonas sp. A601]